MTLPQVSTQPTSSLDWFSISRAASRQAGGAWAFVTEGMPRPPDPKLTPAAPLSLRLPSIGVGAALSRVAGAPRAVLSAAGALYARATSLYDLLFLQPDSPDGPVGLLVRLGVTPARLPWLLTAAIVVTTAVSLAARFSADDRATPRSFVRKSPALKVLRACLLAGFSAWAAWMAWTCLPLDAALSLTAGVVAVESLLPLVLGVAIVWSRGGPDRSVARGRGGALASLLVGSQGGVQWDVSPVLEAPAESDYGKTIESMSVQQLLSVLYPGQDWRNMPPELSADPSNIRKEVLQERSLAWAMARPVR